MQMGRTNKQTLDTLCTTPSREDTTLKGLTRKRGDVKGGTRWWPSQRGPNDTREGKPCTLTDDMTKGGASIDDMGDTLTNDKDLGSPA